MALVRQAPWLVSLTYAPEERPWMKYAKGASVYFIGGVAGMPGTTCGVSRGSIRLSSRARPAARWGARLESCEVSPSMCITTLAPGWDVMVVTWAALTLSIVQRLRRPSGR